MQVVGISHHGEDSSFGHEFLLTSSDHLVPVSAANSSISQPSNHTNGTTSSASPASTLVGSSSGLQINLVWDASVRSSSNWAAIEAAVVAAAQIYTQDFSNHSVLNIAVGSGEVAGSKMGSNALGESESLGYITNYSAVKSALTASDAGLVKSGLMAATALTANNPPTSAEFFVTSAEAKALGLVSGSSTAIDGYIGIGNSSSMFFPANGGKISSGQYDAVGVAAHELSEVMARVSLDGATLGAVKDVYTPLDLFRYTAPNVRDLTPTTGYFSPMNGVGGITNLNAYNDPHNGGDAADWASASIGAIHGVINDAFDAFGTPGVITNVSPTDILEVAALGYNLSSGLPTKSVVA
jgi:hypothetical protein